ncbi:MAG: energy-coupling factor transporter transmembrane component T [Anaerolineae bacterium]|nr:energy-coupling factor transporter transmembrane component T [Anaerolineae bacterium]
MPMAVGGFRLNPISYLAFLAWSLALVALLPDDRAGLLLAAVLGVGALSGGRGLRILTRGRFWVTVASIVALSALLLGERDLQWGFLRLSREGFLIGVWMSLRAVALMLAFAISLGVLSITEMVRLFDAVNLRGLGFALGVALNLGPVLRDAVEAAYHTIRLRGGFRRPLQATRLFLVTVIANALRYGDDVVKSASARAFDLEAKTDVAIAVNRADVVFLCALAAAGAAILILA